MKKLYPPIEPYRVRTVEVSDGHALYVEESGNPQGLPALFLHGGPGSGCEDWHRRFFDPARYRIILFDQRGCGRSTPHASLSGNNTRALVDDIEAIRARLEIDRWLVFGGSWGSTLGLVYAETFPTHVLALVMRGIFLCRRRDIGWFYQDGASFILPDYWQDYLEPVPDDARHDMVTAYYRLLTGDNELAMMSAARAWSLWEGRASTLLPKASVVDHFADPHTALSLARLECHYFVNDSFLEDNQIISQADRLADIPGVIVHGRYDVVCPLEQAWELHRAWPTSQLHVIADAGHSASEPGIVDALVMVTDRYASQLA